MKKFNKSLIVGLSLFVAFVIFTILVKVADVAVIGPLDSKIGLSTINKAVFDCFGQSKACHYVSEVFIYLSVVIGLFFAVKGFVQLIKRKSISKVDYNILILGIFYAVLVAVYLIFEFVVVNYRPVLVDGELKASYPSSHTILALFLIGSGVLQLHRFYDISKTKLVAVDVVSIVLVVILIVTRLLSGMHWLTDIVGGVLIALALVFVCDGVLVNAKSKHENIENKNS